jgi:trans-o-hydroxybenzylidenepyruvate hydratase-aldolase
MIGPKDLSGLMAMMPAFATDDAADIRAVDTVDVERLHKGVDRMVRDGADVITTTGSFGECHSLLADEFRTLAHETAAAVKKRIPLFIGVPSANARETLQKIRMVAETGADGVIVGVPYYIPSSVPNAVQFFKDIAELFPKLGILIYHNPAIHHVTLPVDCFAEIVKSPNVIGMKDSHRDPFAFVKLMNIVRGKMSLFVGQWQYFDYAALGAAGVWSIDAWMGPWPLIALRDAVKRGDKETATAITLDILGADTTLMATNLQWRETAAKIAVRLAGYVDPGPLRAPFIHIPPEVEAAQRRSVERWLSVCEKYRAAAKVPA